MSVERRYFANSVESAVALAKRELGEDTLLIHSRAADAGERHLGAYEVLFSAPDAAPPPLVESASPPPLQLAAQHTEHQDKLLRELRALQREVGSLTGSLARLVAQAACKKARPELAPLLAHLYSVETPASLITELADGAGRRLDMRTVPGAVSPHEARAALAAEIEARLLIREGLGQPGGSRRVTAFAGPPGVGKTLILAKLAMRLGIEERLPTLIVSNDFQRIASAEQLRTYAMLLGLPFQLVETPGALYRTLDEYRHKTVVLIDTPGLGPRDMDLAAEWMAAFGSREEIETQLVLPATMRTADLLAAHERYSGYKPSRLILTHLDETAAYGSSLGVAMLTGLPVSYLSAGQDVPEDLEPATSRRFEQWLLGEAPAAHAAAA